MPSPSALLVQTLSQEDYSLHLLTTSCSSFVTLNWDSIYWATMWCFFFSCLKLRIWKRLIVIWTLICLLLCFTLLSFFYMLVIVLRFCSEVLSLSSWLSLLLLALHWEYFQFAVCCYLIFFDFWKLNCCEMYNRITRMRLLWIHLFSF